MNSTEIDPAAMPLDELRALRAVLQHDDDAVSYVRRVAQVRLDLVRAEQRHRSQGADNTLTHELPDILSTHLTAGGPARPPRPTADFSDHLLSVELDGLCAGAGDADPQSLSDEELDSFADVLSRFEHERSQERRELFARIDSLSAELVRRYRDGEANVDGLLADD